MKIYSIKTPTTNGTLTFIVCNIFSFENLFINWMNTKQKISIRNKTQFYWTDERIDLQNNQT